MLADLGVMYLPSLQIMGVIYFLCLQISMIYYEDRSGDAPVVGPLKGRFRDSGHAMVRAGIPDGGLKNTVLELSWITK